MRRIAASALVVVVLTLLLSSLVVAAEPNTGADIQASATANKSKELPKMQPLPQLPKIYPDKVQTTPEPIVNNTVDQHNADEKKPGLWGNLWAFIKEIFTPFYARK
ncbi:MAG: hypothetical protein V1702_05610 [Candidatus Woesearchaeota archaeon]